MPKLSVINLEPEYMAEAYPLIRCLGHIKLEQWEEFGRRLAEQGGGVLAVRAEDMCIHGVAAYLPTASLKHRRALRVETIAAFEFGHSLLVRSTLSTALDDLAREKNCEVVMVTLDATDPFNRRSRRWRAWESLGLKAEAIECVRHLADPVQSELGPKKPDQDKR
jgi:hypothetical protein